MVFSFPLVSLGQSTEEVGGVGGSGMEQGSGAITTRSDVTVAVESLLGIPAMRLQAIGEAVGTQLPAIRACYAEVIAERPTTEGQLRIRIDIPDGNSAVTFEVARDAVNDRPLTECIFNALRNANLSRIPGPSGGMVVMEFTNTAADGAAMVQREREEAASIVVQTVDGHPEARSRTGEGEVEVVIRGTGDTSAEAVAALYRSVQARIGSLLDCRRRAGRRGASPAGEIAIALTVPRRGAPASRRLESSVAFRGAPQCVIRTLNQASRGQIEAVGGYRIAVRFGE